MFKVSTILFLSLLFLGSCSEQYQKEADTNQTETKTHPTSVDVSILQYTDFSEELIVNGKIESAHLVDLYLSNSGVINYLPVFNGSSVNRGDTIAILENREKKIQLDKARIALQEAENELSSLMLGFGGSAHDTNSINRRILKSLKVRSGYSRALFDVKSAQLNYESTYVISPIRGMIADLNFQTNQWYHATKPLCKIIDNQNFLVRFYITENELPKIKIGQTFKIHTLNNNALKLYGTISEINPMVDEHSLIKVVGKIKSVSGEIMSGMNAKIVIEEVKENSLVIPKKALVLRNNKKVVFTYKSGRAYWNYVETSGENSSQYQISEGLKAGDTIVVKGNLNLAHDAEVIIAENND